LVRFLTDNDLDEPDDGKLMPTAALARLEMPDDWTQLEPGSATVMGIVRPKHLK
jgi:phosphohistidine phosphatase